MLKQESQYVPHALGADFGKANTLWMTSPDKQLQPHRRLLNPTGIAFALLAIGALPIGAIEGGLYHFGMCDPAPLLALLWLGFLSLVGTGFSIWSVYRVEAQGGRIAFPVLAALLNISGLFTPLWLLTR